MCGSVCVFVHVLVSVLARTIQNKSMEVVLSRQTIHGSFFALQGKGGRGGEATQFGARSEAVTSRALDCEEC